MTAGQDVVYANTGVRESENRAENLQKKIDANPKDPHAASELLADAHRGTATEQRAFWQHMQLHNGKTSADTHLPKGFTVVGEDGKHVVKDAKGHTVYDEAKTAAKAEHDAQIHRGEGPYAAFRRQGMTDAEAKAAAKDVKETTGKGNDGFKQGEAYTQDEKGQGNWHKKERDAAELAKQQQAEEAAKKELAIKIKNNELDGERNALDAGTRLAAKALSEFGGFGSTLTKDDIAADLKRTDLNTYQMAGLKYMNENFDKMSKPSSYSALGYSPYIDRDGIAAFRKAQEAQIASERPKSGAS